jgi:hypothetical protein
MISTGREWLHRVESGSSRFARLAMPILQSSHLPVDGQHYSFVQTLARRDGVNN